MKVAYEKIKTIALILGYDVKVHRITCFDFLVRQGFIIYKIYDGVWYLEFQSPQHELLFAIKYSDVL